MRRVQKNESVLVFLDQGLLPKKNQLTGRKSKLDVPVIKYIPASMVEKNAKN